MNEVEITEEVKVKGLKIGQSFWRKIILSDHSVDYTCSGFYLRECEKDSWRCFGHSLDFYGDSPKNCVNKLIRLGNMIHCAIGKDTL